MSKRLQLDARSYRAFSIFRIGNDLHKITKTIIPILYAFNWLFQKHKLDTFREDVKTKGPKNHSLAIR